MRRQLRTSTLSFAAIFVLLGLISLPASSESESLPGWNQCGELESLVEPYEGEVLVLHFWASWCGPCLAELPALSAFYQEYTEEFEKLGVRMVAVNNDVREKDLNRFRSKHDFRVPVCLDSLSKINQDASVLGLPATVFIDRNGEIAGRLHGIQAWEDDAMLARLRSLANQP